MGAEVEATCNEGYFLGTVVPPTTEWASTSVRGQNGQESNSVSIPAIAGMKVEISRVGICGDSRSGSGPNKFEITSGSEPGYTFCAGRSNGHSSCPQQYIGNTNGYNWVYGSLSYTGE